MGSTVSQQLLTFGWSILLGLAAGLLYDLLRPFRLRLPRLTAVLDLLYCLVVGSAVFLFLLRRTGELRMYLLLGIAGGAVVFFCAFSAILRPVWDFWVDTLASLLSLAALPLRWLKIFCKKLWVRGKISFILRRNVIQ